MDILLYHAKNHPQSQFAFLTPLDTSSIKVDEYITIHRYVIICIQIIVDSKFDFFKLKTSKDNNNKLHYIFISRLAPPERSENVE